MKTIRRFKYGLRQSLFSKPKGKTDKMDVYAAHFMVSAQIWSYSKR